MSLGCETQLKVLNLEKVEIFVLFDHQKMISAIVLCSIVPYVKWVCTNY